MHATAYHHNHSTHHPHHHRMSTRRRRHAHALAPRAVIHLLVGALAILSARALTSASFAPADVLFGDTEVVHAEQSTTTSSGVSAPALSTNSPSAATSAEAHRADVLDALNASIGHPVDPGQTTWRGTAGLDMNLRSAPNRSKPPIGTIKAGTPVTVVRWVTGEEIEPANDTWAELSDGSYVFSTSLRRAPLDNPPAPPADAPTSGRWVDVNLTEQVATAYEGREAVKSVLVSTGRPGWDTRTGTFPVLRRVEKDTMDGATLAGQGPNGAGATYKVENVRYVQYFTGDGSAIHENYWRRPATFGMPGSHGCIGMTTADAAWFWSFATVGTPIVIHE
jgi:lipoprotein-anchoring transpeptidase ErfK/SrfK